MVKKLIYHLFLKVFFMVDSYPMLSKSQPDIINGNWLISPGSLHSMDMRSCTDPTTIKLLTETYAPIGDNQR